MARSKKKKCCKKSRATVLQKEALGIRTLLSEAMGRMYRATVAWLRRLVAVLRRAGAAVASNAALLVGHGVPPTREEASDFIFDTADSAPRLTTSPATPPPPTGAKNRASTPPPPTGAENSASTPPPPTGAEICASTPPPLTGAENRASTPPPPTGAENRVSTPPPLTGVENRSSGSQASGSASAPASKSGYSAPRLAPKPATSSPPTGAKNSGSQASCSAPGPASKADSALRLAAKPATLPPPTGAKTTPSAGTEADGFAHNRGLNQDNPFSDGYHLNSLFEEDDCFVVEEDALIYARFCSKRATSLLNKREICHICYFEHGKVIPFKKDELEHHCRTVHHKKGGKNGGFLCKKKGCCIRTSSLKEAGRHHYFCHEKQRDWWVECLKLHGEM